MLKVPKEDKEHKELRVHKVLLIQLQEHKELRVHKVDKVLKELKEHQ